MQVIPTAKPSAHANDAISIPVSLKSTYSRSSWVVIISREHILSNRSVHLWLIADVRSLPVRRRQAVVVVVFVVVSFHALLLSVCDVLDVLSTVFSGCGLCLGVLLAC